MSNAYNRPDQLSPQLRSRVMEAARRMGYPGPDPMARSLRTRKAGAVGLLLAEQVSYAIRAPCNVPPRFMRNGEGRGWKRVPGGMNSVIAAV